MQKVYNRVYWENEPSHNTPLSESNLNKIDYALDVVDTRVVELGGYEERAEESADNADASAIEVRELKRQVQALVDTVKEITATATTLNPGSSATASFDSDTGVLSLGIPKGDSGITAPVNGMYTMYVDEDGNLWLVTNGEQGSEYWWQYNPTTGELYYRTPGEYVEKTIVGDVIVEITDGVEGFPIKSLVAEITPVQSGSGDPSPDNIRPISGRTGMTVTRAGRNIVQINNLTVATGGQIQTPVSDYMTLAAGTYTLSYTLSATVTATRNRPLYRTQGGIVNYGDDIKTAGRGSWTFTLTEETNLRFEWWYHTVSSAVTLSDFMLEFGDTAHEYAPYVAPTTYPITWESIAGTVYGGTLDVVSGVLTVDKGYASFDGTENWNWQDGGTYKRAACPLSDVYNPGGRVSIQSNAGTFRASGNDVGTIFASGTTLFYYPDASITSLADYKTWLASNNLQIVYPLATPQTYQLTPEEIAYIETLNGINILYTDAGSINEVTYIVESYEED